MPLVDLLTRLFFGKTGSGGSDNALLERLAKLEQLSDATLKNKIADLEAALEKRMQGSSGSGWKLPFFLLLLVVFGAAVGLYFFYLRLKKMHML